MWGVCGRNVAGDPCVHTTAVVGLGSAASKWHRPSRHQRGKCVGCERWNCEACRFRRVQAHEQRVAHANWGKGEGHRLSAAGRRGGGGGGGGGGGLVVVVLLLLFGRLMCIMFVSQGTPQWMAPEVIRESQESKGWKKADVWSVGCTVIEMATGKPPWSQYSNPVTAMYHIACRDSLPDFPDSMSSQARDFLALCFQRDPAKRPDVTSLLLHPFVTSLLSSNVRHLASTMYPAGRPATAGHHSSRPAAFGSRGSPFPQAHPGGAAAPPPTSIFTPAERVELAAELAAEKEQRSSNKAAAEAAAARGGGGGGGGLAGDVEDEEDKWRNAEVLDSLRLTARSSMSRGTTERRPSVPFIPTGPVHHPVAGGGIAMMPPTGGGGGAKGEEEEEEEEAGADMEVLAAQVRAVAPTIATAMGLNRPRGRDRGSRDEGRAPHGGAGLPPSHTDSEAGGGGAAAAAALDASHRSQSRRRSRDSGGVYDSRILQPGFHTSLQAPSTTAPGGASNSDHHASAGEAAEARVPTQFQSQSQSQSQSRIPRRLARAGSGRHGADAITTVGGPGAAQESASTSASASASASAVGKRSGPRAIGKRAKSGGRNRRARTRSRGASTSTDAGEPAARGSSVGAKQGTSGSGVGRRRGRRKGSGGRVAGGKHGGAAGAGGGGGGGSRNGDRNRATVAGSGSKRRTNPPPVPRLQLGGGSSSSAAAAAATAAGATSSSPSTSSGPGEKKPTVSVSAAVLPSQRRARLGSHDSPLTPNSNDSLARSASPIAVAGNGNGKTAPASSATTIAGGGGSGGTSAATATAPSGGSTGLTARAEGANQPFEFRTTARSRPSRQPTNDSDSEDDGTAGTVLYRGVVWCVDGSLVRLVSVVFSWC